MTEKIDDRDIQSYIRLPKELLDNASDNLAMFIADNGNHFTEFGIYEGTRILIDLNQKAEKGYPSIFKSVSENIKPKYKISCKRMKGYTHLGKVVTLISGSPLIRSKIN